MDYELANFIVLTINTFMCLSSPINLAIYCGMSRQFRDQFTKIMARCDGYSSSERNDLGLARKQKLNTTRTDGRSMPIFAQCLSVRFCD